MLLHLKGFDKKKVRHCFNNCTRTPILIAIRTSRQECNRVMECVDVMEELVTKLQAFHISARLGRLAQQEYFRLEPIAIEATKTTTPYSLGHRIAGRSLPSPSPEDRPCWEPPILNYSWFEDLIKAQKEMDKREGSRDLPWRTETMDNIVEDALLRTYFYEYLPTKAVPSIADMASVGEESAGEGGDGVEGSGAATSDALFWQGLRRAVWEDIHDLYVEGKQIRKKHGKRNRDHAELLIGVKAIATKKSPDFGSFYQNKRLAVNEHLSKLKVEKLKRQDSRMGLKK